MTKDPYEEERLEMVETQIVRRGVLDKNVLRSMRQVPRHGFVPEGLMQHAYRDGPLLIGEGQTISQPYIVALMTQEALCDGESKVLDIGTGSGYAAAVFSRFVKEVYSIERIASLAEKAKERFEAVGYDNIHVKIGDGTLGWKEHAPYDAIVVTAGAPVVPQSMIDQLTVGGRLIIPVGDSKVQKLMRYRKVDEEKMTEELLEHVRFVPLIGEQGWKS